MKPELVTRLESQYSVCVCRGVYQGEPMEMEAEAEADDTEEETEVQPYQTPSPHPPARLTRRSNAALYCMPAIIAFCVDAQALCLQ